MINNFWLYLLFVFVINIIIKSSNKKNYISGVKDRVE